MGSFLVIGVGGLGCPAALALVAGGARRITLVDHDLVDATNLQRQILFGLADVGAPKVEVARWSLSRRGSTALISRDQELGGDTLDAELEALVEGPEDIVLECSDSPALKFAVHDACVRRGMCVVIGGVVGWRGQLMAVDPRLPDRACYRCVFEAPPPPELSPDCGSAGVVGAVAGQVGWAMAGAAIALDRASHEWGDGAHSPAGRLSHLDLLRAQVHELRPTPRAGCPSCASRPTPPSRPRDTAPASRPCDATSSASRS